MSISNKTFENFYLGIVYLLLIIPVNVTGNYDKSCYVSIQLGNFSKFNWKYGNVKWTKLVKSTGI